MRNFIVLLFFLVSNLYARHADSQYHWAVLIAGSKGWINYRHQSDVYHAYQVLVSHGMPKERIITFAFDDIAHYPGNPYPGKVYNNPELDDVYEGVDLDYTDYDVNRENFLSVLAGDKEAMKGIGSGRVLEAGPEDRVFLFYSDHGSIGVLSLPDYRFLYADQLMDVIEKRQQNGGFKEMVMYIEACEAGSMFTGFNDRMKNVYVATAANGIESSWATYCPSWSGDPLDPVQRINTCMGDLFSVAWMEDSSTHVLRKQSLDDQFKRVADRTSAGGSYFMGSHAMQYGQLDIIDEPVSNYQGTSNVDLLDLEEWWAKLKHKDPPLPNAAEGSAVRYTQVESRDADLHHYMAKLHMAPEGSQEEQQAREEVDTLLLARRLHDDRIYQAVTSLLTSPPALLTLLTPITQSLATTASSNLLTEAQHTLAAVVNTMSATNDGKVEDAQLNSDPTSAFVNSPAFHLMADTLINGRVAPNAALLVEEQQAVVDWECLRGMVDSWEGVCGQLGEYGMKSVRLFANLCNARLDVGVIRGVARDSCAGEAMPVV